MASVTWPNISTVDANKHNAARRQAHNAVHWLVRLANSYTEPGDVSGQAPLVWDASDNVIMTKPFLDKYSVELRVGPLEMQFREGGKPVPHTLDFEERTPAHVEAWVLVELLHRGIDRSRFSKSLPYAPKDLMTGDSEEHEAEAYKDELAVLDGSFRAATAVLKELRGLSDIGIAADAAISCWPETFQIGHEIALPPGSGASVLRVGIAPGDGVRPDPYFFVGTGQQAEAAAFARDAVISMRDVADRRLSVEDVARKLGELIEAQKRKLAG